MKRFKSQRHLQRFVSIHDPIANLFQIPRHDISSSDHRALRSEAINLWVKIIRASNALLQAGYDCPTPIKFTMPRKLLKGQGVAPRVMVTDKLRSYATAKAGLMPSVGHRSHKGLNNRAENSHLPLRRRERRMMRFKSTRQCQRFVSSHGQIANLFLLHRKHLTAADHRQLRAHAISTWRKIAWSIAA
ncbi:transposase-like protein [Rhizobium sp. BK313]|nr:transposase-like protein [Rhizobium sp. BK313]